MTTPQLEQDEPLVTGSPEAIWLVYGDIDRDDTHYNLCSSGEVTWSDTAQFPADVRYTRTDLVAERVRAAVAAERERLRATVRHHFSMTTMSLYGTQPECKAARDALQRLLDDLA